MTAENRKMAPLKLTALFVHSLSPKSPLKFFKESGEKYSNQ
jgi:hypothetical protein